MIGATTAFARVSLASLLLATMFVPTQSNAEFRGKGSIVGRILSESVAEAESPKVPRVVESETASDSEDDAPEAEPPISRDALNALMKHPTIPVFDPLRPMSGRWVRCQSLTGTSLVKSQQDRFSSSDRSHFSHTLSQASDADCKTVVKQERSIYECVAADKKSLSCQVTKRESRTGSGAWDQVKLTGDEKPMKLAFASASKKKKNKREKTRDSRKLEAFVNGDSVMLDFEPMAPHAHKTND